MDYFSIIVLIVVIFIFISDRKLKPISEIKKQENKIEQKTQQIKDNMAIIRLRTDKITYFNIQKIARDFENKYVLIINDKVKLKQNKLNLLIANYIYSKERPCGFNLIYTYKSKKLSLKRIYVDIINYLNIFNKQELSTYGVIICKRSDYINDETNENNEEQFKKKLLPYISDDLIKINFTNKQVEKGKLKNIYVKRISSANISMVIKVLFLILSGSLITTNLIYGVINFQNNFGDLIISAVIYFCYSYVIRYIYKPIGNKKMIASYIFPIYFLSYMVIAVHTLISKVIKNVHAS